MGLSDRGILFLAVVIIIIVSISFAGDSNEDLELVYAEGYFAAGDYGGDSYMVSIDASNVLYNLSNWTVGDYNGFVWSGYGVDTLKTSSYKLQGTISLIGGNGGEYNFGLTKNGVGIRKCANVITASSSQIQDITITCLISLDKGDHLNIVIRDQANPAQDVEIYKTNFNIVEIPSGR